MIQQKRSDVEWKIVLQARASESAKNTRGVPVLYVLNVLEVYSRVKDAIFQNLQYRMT
jgi:hypothetical protein